MTFSRPARRSGLAARSSLAAALWILVAVPGVAQTIGDPTPAGEAPQGQDEFDRLIEQSGGTLSEDGSGGYGVAEDRDYYRNSRPRSPQALGFGAGPSDDPRADARRRPDLVYDEVLDRLRAPLQND